MTNRSFTFLRVALVRSRCRRRPRSTSSPASPNGARSPRSSAATRSSVYIATTALQDPHHIEARPSLIARARNADLVVCTGAELEIGWLPLLMQQSGNRQGPAGQRRATSRPAAFVTPARSADARSTAPRATSTRGGNPHIQTDPRNIAKVAERARARAWPSSTRPTRRLPGAATRTSRRAGARRCASGSSRRRRCKGVPVVVQHKDLTYLWRWLGMREVAALEPKPGVEPSGGAPERMLNAQLQQQPAKMVVRAAYKDPRASQWLAERAQHPGGRPAVHGRRHREGEGPVRPVR